MKMRSRVRTGEECPGGSAVFQITFCLGPNSVGRPLVVDTPVPFGPRNCDQSSESVRIEWRDVAEVCVMTNVVMNAAIKQTKAALLSLVVVLRIVTLSLNTNQASVK